MNLWHWRGPPYVAETFAFLSFCAFLHLIVKILIRDNKKNFKDLKPIESWKHKKHNQIWTKITTPQQNTRKQTVKKTNKKEGKKKEGNLPKPLPSFSFFRPLSFLLPTAIYTNKTQIFADHPPRNANRKLKLDPVHPSLPSTWKVERRVIGDNFI